MPSYLPILFVVATILIVGMFMIAHGVAERKRTAAWQRAAHDFGWTFSAKGHDALRGIRDRLRLFGRGRRKVATNVIAGRLEDLEVFLFDYAFTTGGGKSQTRRRQSVAAVRRNGPPCPAFELRPEGLLLRFTELFGAQDIDFDEFPEFSRRYALSGQDEPAIRALFSADVIAYFESVPKGLVVETDGEWTVVYRDRRRVAADRLSALLEEAVSVAGLLDGAAAT